MQIFTSPKKTFLTKFLPSALLVGAAISSFLFLKDSEVQEIEEKRVKYEKFLASHPYKKRVKAEKEENEKEEKAKTDRPDQAMLQDVLRTMDPALGYVPVERLDKAYAMVKNQKVKSPLGYNWTERGPSNVGGRTRTIMFDPNDATNKKVWTGGVGGGLWYCNDITITPVWNKVNDVWDNIAITSIAYDPSNTQVFYVGTGEGWYNMDAIRGAGIWKTTDGGSNWTRLSTTSSFDYIQKIVVHPVSGDVYAATRSNGVMRSQNGGTTWTKVLGSSAGALTNAVSDLEIGADNTIYAGLGIYGSDGVYSSTTGNSSSWTKISYNTGFPSSGFYRIELATAPSDANVLYAILESSSTRDALGIYKSVNKGSSWTTLTSPEDDDGGISPSFTRTQAWYDLSMAVDPNNANNVIVGGVDLFKTTNGGSTWTQISHWYGGFGYPEVHADQHTVVYRPGSSTTALFGNDGGVYYSSNVNTAAPSFTAKNTGYNVTQFYSCAINPNAGSNNFLAGSQDNGTQKFTTAGVNATTEVYGGDGAFCFIDQDNPTYQIASYVYNNFYLSDDGGLSFWNTLVSDDSYGSFINPADYDDRENILFANGTSSVIMRVMDVTGSYYQDDMSVSLNAEASHIRVSPYAPVGTSTIFVGTESGRVYKITNAHTGSPSVTNISAATFPIGSVSCIEVGASENELLVTFSNYGVTSVWYTSNGGTNWVGKEGNLPDMPVRWALFNPSNRKEVMLATQVGIWGTSDISVGTPTWTNNSTGFPNTRVDMLQLRASDNMVIAATHGRGLFSTDGFNNTAPSASFTASTSSVCGNAGVTFTNTSSGTVSTYVWNFGAGASPATAATAGPHTVTYSGSGTKTVTLIISGGSGADTVSSTITVYPSPTVNATPSHILCNGSSTGSAVASGSGGTSPYTYAWSGGGTGATKTGLSAGAHVVTVTDNAGCKATASVTITQPTVITTSVTKTNANCGQNDGSATVSVSGGNTPYTYLWSNGATGATATGLATGNHTVTVTDANGCTKTNSANILTNTTLVANAGNALVICNGENIVIGGSPAATGGTSPYTYAWAPSSSLSASTSANPTASPTTTTTYSLTVVDAMGCAMIDAVVVTVKPTINADYTQSMDTAQAGVPVTFNGTGTGVTSWSWTFGDGGTSSSQNPSHTYTAAGKYAVEMMADNGTCAEIIEDTIVVSPALGIVGVNDARRITLYPNPASQLLNVGLKGMNVSRIYIINTLGQQVWLKNNPSEAEKIDVSSFKEGAYFLKIEGKGGTVTRKITISR